jgi:hypothetical protein
MSVAHLEYGGDLRLYPFAVAALASGGSAGPEGHAVEHIEMELSGEQGAPFGRDVDVLGEPSIPRGPCEEVVEMSGVDERADGGSAFACREKPVGWEKVPAVE